MYQKLIETIKKVELPPRQISIKLDDYSGNLLLQPPERDFVSLLDKAQESSKPEDWLFMIATRSATFRWKTEDNEFYIHGSETLQNALYTVTLNISNFLKSRAKFFNKKAKLNKEYSFFYYISASYSIEILNGVVATWIYLKSISDKDMSYNDSAEHQNAYNILKKIREKYGH